MKSLQKEFVCRETIKMLNKYPEFQLGAITVKKEQVNAHIRLDGNKLYNYMIRLSILDKISAHQTCKLTRDNRSVKVASGNSCIDYLQMILLFDHSSATQLKDNPLHSHENNGLIFIDWITNIVWSRYEDNYHGWFDILSPHLKNQTLYF